MDKKFKEFSLSSGPCFSCMKLAENYMLIDDLWNSIVKPNEQLLCLLCVKKRLKRKLNLKDFNNSLVNNGIFGFEAKKYCKNKNYKLKLIYIEDQNEEM